MTLGSKCQFSRVNQYWISLFFCQLGWLQQGSSKWCYVGSLLSSHLKWPKPEPHRWRSASYFKCSRITIPKKKICQDISNLYKYIHVLYIYTIYIVCIDALYTMMRCKKSNQSSRLTERSPPSRHWRLAPSTLPQSQDKNVISEISTSWWFNLSEKY